MMMKLEYMREDGEQTILEGRFLKWHINKKGENYLTFKCVDSREDYRRLKPERIVSVSRSFLEEIAI